MRKENQILYVCKVDFLFFLEFKRNANYNCCERRRFVWYL